MFSNVMYVTHGPAWSIHGWLSQAPAEAAMKNESNETNNSYFLIDAGHPRAIFRPPADFAQRLLWEKWLKGAIAVAACGSVAALLLAGTTVSPLEATVQMERLAARAEHAKRIDPATAHEIARLIGQRWYDCSQVACSAQLQQRNRAARRQLSAVLQAKAPETELSASRKAMA